MTKPGDIDHFTRVRIYNAVLGYYEDGSAFLSLLPLAMRMAGPREALWHCIIRRNYGCNMLIIGRDHAGPGKASDGQDFYEEYEAQELAKKHAIEIGIQVVPFSTVSYVPAIDKYLPSDQITVEKTLNISGTELRRRLTEGEDIPDWFTFSKVKNILLSVYPPKKEKGNCILFVGNNVKKCLSACNAMYSFLSSKGARVTLLNSEIQNEFSQSFLTAQAFLASEILKNRGTIIGLGNFLKTAKDFDYFKSQVMHGDFITVHLKQSNEKLNYQPHIESDRSVREIISLIANELAHKGNLVGS